MYFKVLREQERGKLLKTVVDEAGHKDQGKRGRETNLRTDSQRKQQTQHQIECSKVENGGGRDI